MLEEFFTPKTVAVVGVAREPGKVGHFVFQNLISGGFKGEVWPVNPKADEILGHPCFPNIAALPRVPSLVVIAVPAFACASVVADCGEKGVHSAVVLSAGFKETGAAGARLEHELVEAAHAAGVALLGPNSLGLVATPSHLNASFAGAVPLVGGVAFLSQSGALGTAILDESASGGAGLAYFVSLGNRSDVDESALLKAWTTDSSVRMVAAYLESIKDGPAFISAAREFTRNAPLVVLKAGTSDAGARAVSSHTGSLAGSDSAYNAAIAAAGALRVRTSEELLDAALAFDLLDVPLHSGTGILTNAGGLGVLATDEAERRSLSIASLENETVEALRELLPPAAAFYNPVDVLGDAPPQRYGDACSALLADPGVHSLLVLFTPQAMSEPEATAVKVVAAAAKSKKPVAACFAGGASLEGARAVLRKGGVPCYPTAERAVQVLALLDAQRRRLDRVVETPIQPDADIARARALLDQVRASGNTFATDETAAEVAQCFGIPTPGGGLATSLSEACSISEKCGYPVVLKISSPDILHKSDVGGVVVGVADEAALTEAYETLLDRIRMRVPGAIVRGVYVQAMAPKGRELIVGIDRDATFGPMLMVGLGGVYVEVMKDVTFRLCPVTTRQAREMLSELKGYALLRGVRGEASADIDAAAEIISAVSWLAVLLPEVVELDINPVIVGDRGTGALAADVRIGIGG